MVCKQQGWQGTDAAKAFIVGIMQSPASGALQGAAGAWSDWPAILLSFQFGNRNVHCCMNFGVCGKSFEAHLVEV